MKCEKETWAKHKRIFNEVGPQQASSPPRVL